MFCQVKARCPPFHDQRTACDAKRGSWTSLDGQVSVRACLHCIRLHIIRSSDEPPEQVLMRLPLHLPYFSLQPSNAGAQSSNHSYSVTCAKHRIRSRYVGCSLGGNIVLLKSPLLAKSCWGVAAPQPILHHPNAIAGYVDGITLAIHVLLLVRCVPFLMISTVLKRRVMMESRED